MNAAQPTRYPVKPQQIIAPVFAVMHVSPAVEELTGRLMAKMAKRESRAVDAIGRHIPVQERPSHSIRCREIDDAARRLLEFVAEQRTTTAAEIERAMGYSNSRAGHLCRKLVQQGLLHRFRQGNNGPYSYTTSGKDAVQREAAKITGFVEAIRQNPGISALELSKLLGVGLKYVTDTARNLDAAGRIVRSRAHAAQPYVYTIAQKAAE